MPMDVVVIHQVFIEALSRSILISMQLVEKRGRTGNNIADLV